MFKEKDKWLNSIKFKGDGEISCSIGTVFSVWEKYRDRLEKIKEKCPHVSFSVSKDPIREKKNKYLDKWGCLWFYPGGYLDGQVIGHPLKDWSNFKDYKMPDPKKYVDWEEMREKFKEIRKEGKVVSGFVEHGFLYLLLTYLRGFENLMIDIAEERKELEELINKITDYWIEVVKRWIDLEVDVIYFGDDLGLQKSLPIKPSSWRKYIKPAYKKIFSFCRENQVEVYLHTDGYVVDIIPDLIETGVSILNVQDLVNGLGNLEKLAKGKVFIDLDIDRQKITAFGKPEEIKSHILNCIKSLGSPFGGLGLSYWASPGTPIENIEAVFLAMEEHHNYWKRK